MHNRLKLFFNLSCNSCNLDQNKEAEPTCLFLIKILETREIENIFCNKKKRA